MSKGPEHFSSKTQLIRAIHPDHVTRDGRAASAAYVRRPLKGGTEKYLSVCTADLETFASITQFFYKGFLKSKVEQVHSATHTITSINNCTKECKKISIAYDRTQKVYTYNHNKSNKFAYTHEPGSKMPSDNGFSHSGIKFVEAFDELDEINFSDKMSKAAGKLQITTFLKPSAKEKPAPNK